MDFQKEFLQIMKEQPEVALATCIDNIPNVRIVNFYYDPSIKTLFFSTFPDSKKIIEIENNMNVAFTTISKGDAPYIKAQGVAKKSQKLLNEISDRFVEKTPDCKEMLEQFKDILVLYEVSITKATVTIDHENISEIEV